MKEKRKFSNSIWYTILMVLLFMLVVPIILYIPLGFIEDLVSKSSSPVAKIVVDYLFYPGVTLISFIILMRMKENKDLCKVFSLKNNKIAIGLLIGFSFNCICAFIAYLCGNIKFELGEHNIFIFLIAFICVAVQSTSEEVICRGYMLNKILKDYNKPLLAILFNSALFGLFHIFNDGVTVLAIVSIFIDGILLSLLTYYNKNLWEAAAYHTMWNFTQNFLLGLPNSGYPATYSVLKVVESSSGFAYDKVFGVESTIVAVLLDVIAIIVVQLIYSKSYLKKKKSKKNN